MSNFQELCRITENSVDRPANCAGFLERAKGLVDLGAACAKQQGNLVLGHVQFDREAFAGRRLAITNRNEQEARQSNVQGVKRDRLQLVAGLSQTPAEKRDQSLGHQRACRPQTTKVTLFKPEGADRGQGCRIGRSDTTVEKQCVVPFTP